MIEAATKLRQWSFPSQMGAEALQIAIFLWPVPSEQCLKSCDRYGNSRDNPQNSCPHPLSSTSQFWRLLGRRSFKLFSASFSARMKDRRNSHQGHGGLHQSLMQTPSLSWAVTSTRTLQALHVYSVCAASMFVLQKYAYKDACVHAQTQVCI